MTTTTRTSERKNRLPLVDRQQDESYFPDTGCSVHPSCLNCPLARCIYDEPEEERREAQQARDREIYRLYRESRTDIQSLAERFGVSRRTVHRAVARCKTSKG